MKSTRYRWLSVVAALLLAVTTLGFHPGYAQGDSHTFPETGKTVKGSFLAYWTNHGALAQQGYPISDEMQEVSATDGKTYTVQYFERAVFEEHPEFAGTPNEVLLSLLGTFRYNQKYPGGAPSQSPNNEINSQMFSATGHRLGGKFLDYWTNHGALAQQGYPISDEFIEISEVDGKPYKVQYFERAVFEYHPENQPPNDVLLSLLGVYRYKEKYVTPSPTPTVAIPPTPTTPVLPTSTPTPAQPAACDSDVPQAKDATITPRCGPIGTVFHITARGFAPGEKISYWDTLPSGEVYGTARPLDFGNHPGTFTDSIYSIYFAELGDAAYGIWASTYQGEQSGHQSTVWYKVTRLDGSAPTATPIPSGSCDLNGTKDAVVSPTSGRAGTVFSVTVTGFQGGETASYWLTDPTGAVYGTRSQLQIPSSGGGTLQLSTSGMPVGRWALTIHGLSSNHESIGVFCITP